MTDHQSFAMRSGDIPCLRPHAGKIDEYMGEKPETSALTFRHRFESFVSWAEEMDRKAKRKAKRKREENPRTILQMPIAPSDIVGWAESLEGRGMAQSTISSYVSAIGTIHTAANLYNPTTDSKVKVYLSELRERHTGDDKGSSVRALSVTDIEKILSTLYIPRRTRGGVMESHRAVGKRAGVDKAMLLTMIHAGMRRDEAARLLWSEVRERRDGAGEVLLLYRKGATRNSVWMAVDSACFQALLDIKPEGADDSDRVFNLSGSQITRRLKNMCKEAGIDPTDVGGDTPRATLLELMVEQGAPFDKLRWQLRKKPVSLVERYIQNTPGVGARVYREEEMTLAADSDGKEEPR